MNTTEYIALLNNPKDIIQQQTDALEKIVQEFPYFQSARALYLKGLYNQNSFKYNYALKITAAHSTDRSVLFDFITSNSFSTIQPERFAKKTYVIVKPIAEDLEEFNELKLEARENTVEQSILTSIKEADSSKEEIKIEEKNEHKIAAEQAIEKNIVALAENKLEIGKPIAFASTEKHSFQEWLQLSQIKPIDREVLKDEPEATSESQFVKQKKNVLIDKFIEANPKIPPVKKNSEILNSINTSFSADTTSLMTETLARVYLEQKKYQKAIQAYEILILKYPEKSSFFADRISDIKNLEQNNT